MMAEIKGPAEAGAALTRAAELVEDVADGVLSEKREARALGEARALLDGVLAFRRAQGDAGPLAEVLELVARMLRHAEFAPDRAAAPLEEAAALYGQAGDGPGRMRVLMELGEIDPAHEGARAAAGAAVAAGLAPDMPWQEDPRRLAVALREAGDPEAAMALYTPLLAEAEARGAGGRAALLLRDIARIHEDDRKDRKAATAALERAVALAEAAGDRPELGAALLRLTDIHMECGRKPEAEAAFRRVLALKGLPRWQKELIGPMKTYFPGL